MPSFYDRPQVQMVEIPIGDGVPFGFETVSNPKVGISGVYGTWGKSYNNTDIHIMVEQSIGRLFIVI